MRVSYEAVTTSLGPGERYVIWVQGCKKRCNGCINPEGQDENGGHERNAEDILEDICSKRNLTGITISGGEPFLQAEEIRRLLRLVKSKTGLDVMLYSGYTYEELLKIYGSLAEDIFALTDIFIDGEYVEELNNNSMYRGSDNQKIYFFTDKYRYAAPKINSSKNRDFSFRISEEGEVYFIGIPPVGFYKKFLEHIAKVND